MNNIVNLYAIPLVVDTQIYKPTVEDISYLKKEPTKKARENNVTESTSILEMDYFSNLKHLVNNSCNRYVKEVLEIKNEIYLASSWAAISKKGEKHHNHNHPGVFISCVFYLQCQTGNLIMTRPRSMLQEGFNFTYDIDKWNSYNCTKWEVPARTGDLVIFPGWLNHETSVNESDDDRIIIGANYFLKGKLGTNEGLDVVNL